MIHVLYFASVRERLNCRAEEIALTGNIQTIVDLKNLLSERGDKWQEVFACNNPVLFSVNQVMAKNNQSIEDGDEIAFFPQVTGG